MLEFKNIVLPSTDDVAAPASFSLVISPGNVACLCGESGKGKTTLLQAIMGLTTLRGGYITIDGELVSRGSSEYFRHQIAYVPQRLPDVREKVSELCEQFFRMKVNRDVPFTREQLTDSWTALNLDAALWDCWITDIGRDQLWLVLLSLTPLLDRRILLLDDPVQSAAVDGFIARMASEGKEVLYACRENALRCTKVVNI